MSIILFFFFFSLISYRICCLYGLSLKDNDNKAILKIEIDDNIELMTPCIVCALPISGEKLLF